VSGRTLEQERARHAYLAVERAKKLGDRERTEYGREAKKLPVRIVNSGLGAALLFLKAKKDRARALREALDDWISRRHAPAGTKDLVHRIQEGDSRFLRLATAESLAYLQWLVRFAEAENLVPEGGEE
jgi:CRISPR-associated protein Cmr5